VLRRIGLLVAAAFLATMRMVATSVPTFAAHFRCTVDPAAPACQSDENETTQNANDETATGGNSGPHSCTEQGNSGKRIEDRLRIGQARQLAERYRRPCGQHLDSFWYSNSFWYSTGALQRSGAFSLPDEVGARPTLAVGIHA
jgi:hypothetical protein